MVHATRSSGVLSSVVWADGLVEIPEGCTLAPGDWVDYLPFAALLN
jgi:molybdopterin molybdotransferase